MMEPSTATPNKPEQLIATVLHLMSHYSTNSVLNREQGVCVKLAAVIERHLTILSELPGLAPVLRATCNQLSEQWALVVEQTLQQQYKAALTPGWRQRLHLN